MAADKHLTHHKKVIPFKAYPDVWTFWDYGENGNNKIEEWYDQLSEDAKNLFQSLLKNNRKVKLIFQWIGFRGFLKGALKGSGIWELGFRTGTQHRILGYCGPKRMEITLLIGCYHKQSVYTPADALATALKRKNKLEQGVGEHYERTIQTRL